MANAGLCRMVAELRKGGYLHSKDVESALLAVDRTFFVPSSTFAYEDRPFPIGFGQTISAPSVVSFMLGKLDVRPGQKVLEVGTGSGYNAALVSFLVGKNGKVITVEPIPQLVSLAKENISKAGSFPNIVFIKGDGSCGYEKEAPYDRIIVTAAMPYLDDSHPLISQLKEDGKLIAPVGDRFFQNLILYDKKSKGFQSVLPVVFVPLIGKCGFQKEVF